MSQMSPAVTVTGLYIMEDPSQKYSQESLALLLQLIWILRY